MNKEDGKDTVQNNAITEYLDKILLPPEERINIPMEKNCRVCVVIPAYGERDFILRPLSSLARQKNVTADRYEVIIVVNNPREEPTLEKFNNPGFENFKTRELYEEELKFYHEAIKNNMETINLINYINGKGTVIFQKEEEKEIVKEIRESGLKVFVLDKASPGKTLPKGMDGVAGARNRGVAEAVARFYYQVMENGIVAQTDADTIVDDYYIRNIIKIFSDKKDLVGLVGHVEFKSEHSDDGVESLMLKYFEVVNEYDELLKNYVRKKNNPGFINKQLSGASGANIASRAFETAIIGGIPTAVADGDNEDRAFCRMLSTVGEVRKTADVITKTLIRYSIRCTNGFGFQLLKNMKALALKKEIKVQSTANALYVERIVGRLNGELTEDCSKLETLQDILSIDNHSILSEEELKKFLDIFARLRDARDFVYCAVLDEINKKIFEKIDRKFPPLELRLAIPYLIRDLCLDENLKTLYLYILDQKIEKIRLREIFINDLLDRVFKIKESENNPDMEKLQDYLSTEAIARQAQEGTSIGIKYNIRPIINTICETNSKEELYEKLKNYHNPFLLLPGENTMEYKFLELDSLFEAVLIYEGSDSK